MPSDCLLSKIPKVCFWQWWDRLPEPTANMSVTWSCVFRWGILRSSCALTANNNMLIVVLFPADSGRLHVPNFAPSKRSVSVWPGATRSSMERTATGHRSFRLMADKLNASYQRGSEVQESRHWRGVFPSWNSACRRHRTSISYSRRIRL